MPPIPLNGILHSDSDGCAVARALIEHALTDGPGMQGGGTPMANDLFTRCSRQGLNRCAWCALIGSIVAVLPGKTHAQHAADISEGRLIKVLKPITSGEDEYAPVITALAIHPDGKLLAAAGDDHIVRLWDIDRGVAIRLHRGHRDWVRSAAFSAQGDQLLTAAADGRVLMWHTHQRTRPQTVLVREGSLLSLAVSRDGRLAVLAGFNAPVQLVGTEGTRSLHQFSCGCNDIRAVAVSPDNRFMACGGRDGIAYVWSLDTNRMLHVIKAHSRPINCLAFGQVGSQLITGADDRRVCAWDCETGELQRAFSMGRAKALSLVSLTDGGLACGGTDNAIRVWDLETGERLATLGGHSGSVATLAAQGDLLASGSYDTTVRVWSLTGLLGEVQASRTGIQRH